MFRSIASSCLFLATALCAAAAHAAPPPAPSPSPAPPTPAITPAPASACPKPELLFDYPHRRPGIAAPHSLQWPLRPAYPASLQDTTKAGSVMVDYIVKLDGTLCNVSVKSVEGPADFVDATKAWLASSPFMPAKKQGKPIVSEVKHLILFRSQEPPAGAPASDADP